jgi:hypothetical protein
MSADKIVFSQFFQMMRQASRAASHSFTKGAEGEVVMRVVFVQRFETNVVSEGSKPAIRLGFLNEPYREKYG